MFIHTCKHVVAILRGKGQKWQIAQCNYGSVSKAVWSWIF